MANRRSGAPHRAIRRTGVLPEILVFTEGERTEVQYLTHWWRRHRESVRVTIDPFHGGPLQLVRHAVARQKADKIDERKGRGRAPSEIWCMFDIDEHPHLPDSLQLARDHGIRTAVSNPCFEVWYLLHFQDRAAWIDRHSAQADAGGYVSRAKSLTPDDLNLLVQRYEVARGRAQHLARRHEANGNPAGDNPSSTVCELVDSIRRAPIVG